MAKSDNKRRFKIGGLPVVDATMPLIVKITARDIKGAERRSSDCCAAARALCREHPEIEEAHVYMTRTYLKKPTVIERYITPPALRLETMAHDRAGIFMPGEFKLGAPKGSLRLGVHAGGKRKTKTGMAPRAHHVVVGVRPVAPKGRASLGFK